MLAPLEREQARLDAALEALRELLADADAPPLAQIARRAGELRVELAAVTAMKEPSRVYFAEVRGRGVFLRAAPIDVAEELQARLYRSTDTVIFTSATLAAQGRFDYFRRQVGLAPRVRRGRGASSRARSTTRARRRSSRRPGCPSRTQPGFVEAAAAGAIRELTAVTGGRAFVLCTSIRNMLALHAALADLPYQLLLQGERPKARLLEAFRERALGALRDGELLGGRGRARATRCRSWSSTGSRSRRPATRWWRPGCARSRRRGATASPSSQVPAAALALRQGFGRLVRTRDDRGLVAVLDRRLVTKGYGRAFLASLPQSPLLRSSRRRGAGGTARPRTGVTGPECVEGAPALRASSLRPGLG